MRFELAARFDKIRNLLLTDRYAPQLSHPLCATGRCRPIADLPRALASSLRSAICCELPYDSLAAVPGIGQKKMQSLLKLLDRALHTDELEKERLEHIAPQLPRSFRILSSPRANPSVAGISADPSNISEVTWATWRNDGVIAHRLGPRTARLLRRIAQRIAARDLERAARDTTPASRSKRFVS
jgi:hypothetical protein